MVGHFPCLYDDEPLYNGCARYGERLGHRNSREIREDLFGVKSMRNVEAFPNRLDHLASELPACFGITSDSLIAKNTFYPFIAPFLTEKSALTLMKEMKGNSLKTYASRLHGAAALSPCMRYCPICAERERQKLGEAYWHRLHQIAAVQVCPEHRVFLENSKIRRGEHTTVTYYIGEANIPQDIGAVRRLDPNDPWHELLLWIARECDWLLRHPGFRIDRDQLLRFYRAKIWAAGYARFGTTLVIRFVAAFAKAYRIDWLKQLKCPLHVETRATTWVHDVLARGDGNPIQHLLVMRLLGLDLGKFVEFRANESFFEAGPWPCLNSQCKFWNMKVVTDCKIATKRFGLVEGTFRCSSCGHSYSRIGPDPDGRFRRRAYKRNPRQILKASRRSVETEREYKARVRAYIRAHPRATRSELRDRLPTEMWWFWAHRKNAFLEGVLPSRKRPKQKPRRPSQDWAARDARLAAKIPEIYAEILSMPGQPRRATRSRMLILLGFRQGVLPEKLEKTDSAVKRAVESDEDFVIRRLFWWAQKKHLKHRTINSILHRVKIRPKMQSKPRVKEAIRIAEQLLNGEITPAALEKLKLIPPEIEREKSA